MASSVSAAAKTALKTDSTTEEQYMSTTTNDKTQAFISDLEQVLDHLWDSEKRDCEAHEGANRTEHIFTALQFVRNWLDENRAELLRDQRYNNGWSNYETWAVNLWLTNTEEDYLYWRDAARPPVPAEGQNAPLGSGRDEHNRGSRPLPARRPTPLGGDGCLLAKRLRPACGLAVRGILRGRLARGGRRLSRRPGRARPTSSQSRRNEVIHEEYQQGAAAPSRGAPVSLSGLPSGIAWNRRRRQPEKCHIHPSPRA